MFPPNQHSESIPVLCQSFSSVFVAVGINQCIQAFTTTVLQPDVSVGLLTLILEYWKSNLKCIECGQKANSNVTYFYHIGTQPSNCIKIRTVRKLFIAHVVVKTHKLLCYNSNPLVDKLKNHMSVCPQNAISSSQICNNKFTNLFFLETICIIKSTNTTVYTLLRNLIPKYQFPLTMIPLHFY